MSLDSLFWEMKGTGGVVVAHYLTQTWFTSGENVASYRIRRKGTPPEKSPAKDIASWLAGIEILYAPWGFSVGAAWQESSTPLINDPYSDFRVGGDCGENRRKTKRVTQHR